MSIFSPVLCFLGRHEPLRRNVERHGNEYVGHCRHCGKDIHRVARHQWRLHPEASHNA